MSASAKIKALAGNMRLKKDKGERFVLMLGAGASMSSGVISTPRIMQELLDKYGQDLAGNEPLDLRFDKLWSRTQRALRNAYLEPYLNHTPSDGYAKLAKLIEAGYFDLALTFNFDALLEKALRAIGFQDLKVATRGETIDEEIQTLVTAKAPRFKLVKLHGSLDSTDHFLFDAKEMHQYPPAIESLVTSVTSRDIIVCGYAFNDLCVSRAFSECGGCVIWVNPAAVPRDLRLPLSNRQSDDWAIEQPFDDFFTALHDELLAPKDAEAAPPPNPFKFLESYEEADRDAFHGREEEMRHFAEELEKAPRVVVVAGPAKAGKTSLVKAGLLPALDSARYQGVYVRCQEKFGESTPSDLLPGGAAATKLTVSQALQQLSREAGERRVVLFLDQFERPTGRFDASTKAGREGLGRFLKEQLFAASDDKLTLVLVVVEGGALVPTLLQACQEQKLSWALVQCAAFEREEVATIIQSLATQGGFEFEPRIIEEMLQSYVQTKALPLPNQRFTLAHIQAVCHILATTREVRYDTYRTSYDGNLAALHQAINLCDIISFVEDFPWSDAVWFRNMIKVALKMSKEQIAGFIKNHYAELVPKPGGKASGWSFDVPGTGWRP